MVKLDCPKCHNHRHYRTEKGWARCDCFWDSLALTGFIKPPLRTPADGLLPEAYHHVACWPLEDKLVEGGSFDQFRFTAWRSLLELYDYGISYLNIDGGRIIDIFFNREPDPELATMQALVDWQLVIMVLGVFEIPSNPYYDHAVFRAFSARQFAGKPTWVYARNGFPRLQEPARRQQISSPVSPALPSAPPVPLDAPPMGLSLMDSAKRLFTKKPNGGAL